MEKRTFHVIFEDTLGVLVKEQTEEQKVHLVLEYMKNYVSRWIERYFLPIEEVTEIHIRRMDSENSDTTVWSIMFKADAREVEGLPTPNPIYKWWEQEGDKEEEQEE